MLHDAQRKSLRDSTAAAYAIQLTSSHWPHEALLHGCAPDALVAGCWLLWLLVCPPKKWHRPSNQHRHATASWLDEPWRTLTRTNNLSCLSEPHSPPPPLSFFSLSLFCCGLYRCS